MHIASSTVSLYPVRVASAQKSAIGSGENSIVPKAAVDVTALRDQTTDQRTRKTRKDALPTTGFSLARSNIEGVNFDGLTQPSNRVFSGVTVEGVGKSSVQGSLQSAGQRAVAEYADVATQEHRDELVALLGIDVFA